MNGKEEEEIHTKTGMTPNALVGDSERFRLWLMDHMLCESRKTGECIAKIHGVLEDHGKRIQTIEEAGDRIRKYVFKAAVLIIVSALAGGGVAAAAKEFLVGMFQ